MLSMKNQHTQNEYANNVYVHTHIFIITEYICNSYSLEQTVGNAGVEQKQKKAGRKLLKNKS